MRRAGLRPRPGARSEGHPARRERSLPLSADGAGGESSRAGSGSRRLSGPRHAPLYQRRCPADRDRRRSQGGPDPTSGVPGAMGGDHRGDGRPGGKALRRSRTGQGPVGPGRQNREGRLGCLGKRPRGRGALLHGGGAGVLDGEGRLVQERGRIHILVNNAGIARDSLLMRMKPDDWESVIATNVNGLYYCSQAVLLPMIRQRGGRIINMSSVVGLTGNPGQANYAASKAAILGFTKALAREVASRQITVNAIAPGYIETDMTRNISEDARKALFDSLPMKRIGRPEDVAATGRVLPSGGGG